MKKDDELRKKLTALLEDYEAEPEEKTWGNIRAAIQPERRRKPWLPFFFGIGLALLIASVAGWWLFPENNERVAACYVPHASGVLGHRAHAGWLAVFVGNTLRTVPTQPGRTIIGIKTSGAAAKHAKNVHLAQHNIVVRPLSASGTTAVNIPVPAVVPSETPFSAPAAPDFSQEMRLLNPEKAIGMLATPTVLPLPSRKSTPSMPAPLEAQYRLRTPYRPLNYWTIGGQLLHTSQTMTALTHDEHTATNIRQRRGMSPQRTGISVGVGYRRALRARFDVGLGAQWTNIPLETRYDVATLKEFDVLINGNDQFEVKPRTQFTVDQNRRLNQAALHAEAGYTFRLHRRYLRWGAGAGGNITFQSGEQPQFWWFTGLETPIGYSKYVFSAGYRRMQGQFVQPDQLLSTRLHAVEIGLKRKF
jgi:hypothetical protein